MRLAVGDVVTLMVGDAAAPILGARATVVAGRMEMVGLPGI
jgi:hypothetical protein